METKAKSLKKDELLALWADKAPTPVIAMGPIPYRHEGTTIAEDGIRICGDKPFILSVLSRLKDLLKYENGETRLGVAFSEIQDIKTGAIIEGQYRCSVQVHQRGPQAVMMNAYTAGARKRQAARAQEETRARGVEAASA